jgi:Mg-chelatase subunit ChlD
MNRFPSTILLLAAAFAIGGCDKHSNSAAVGTLSKPAEPQKEGIAIAIVIDTSGSMKDPVNGGVKIELAKKSVAEVAQLCQAYAASSPERPIQISLYQFESETKNIFPLSAPDVSKATTEAQKLTPGGGTALGSAVIAAKADLDASGFKTRRIVVITDGESNEGPDPTSVAMAIEAQAPGERCGVSVIAFDVNAGVFAGVKQHGWKIYSASNAAELSKELGILIENDVFEATKAN